MEQLIAIIEKGQPFFNAIARNKYLKAIRRRLYLRHPHHHLLVHLLPRSLGPQHLGFLLAR